VAVFKKDEPQEPIKAAPKAKSSSTRRPRTNRSRQVVAPTPTPSGILSVFTTNTPASSAAYNVPRSLTAAAVQVKVNDKGEFEQFKNRRSASSSAWQAEAWEYYDAIG